MRAHSIVLFFTILILLLNFSSSDKACSYSIHEEIIPGSIYQSNLQQLLVDLPRNAPQNSYFYNTTYGKDPDVVYGLAMCYADATLAECNSCLTGGSTDILELCNSTKSGVAWYDACMMRYSDASFNATNSIGAEILGPKGNSTWQLNLTDTRKYVNTFAQLIGSLATNASKSPLKIAAGTMNYTWNGTIYALVQCTRYIPPDECRSCLANLTDLIGALGLTEERQVTSDWTVKTVSCYVRSAFRPFYVIPDAHSPWPDPTNNIVMRSRESSRRPTSLFSIIIGVMLVVLLVDVHN